jgi:hypothetical protein
MTLFCPNLGRGILALPKRTLALGLSVLLAFAALAGAQTWTPLVHQPTLGASTALLLTDGTVMQVATHLLVRVADARQLSAFTQMAVMAKFL